MNKILELREKRAKTWENAKNFLDNRRNENGIVSDEDNAVYEKMETEVVNLGKEIDRLERQAAIDLELSKAVDIPIKEKPAIAEKPEKIHPQNAPRRSSLKGNKPIDPNQLLKIKKGARHSVSFGQSNTFQFKAMKAMFQESHDVDKTKKLIEEEHKKFVE